MANEKYNVLSSFGSFLRRDDASDRLKVALFSLNTESVNPHLRVSGYFKKAPTAIADLKVKLKGFDAHHIIAARHFKAMESLHAVQLGPYGTASHPRDSASNGVFLPPQTERAQSPLALYEALAQHDPVWAAAVPKKPNGEYDFDSVAWRGAMSNARSRSASAGSNP